MLNRYRNRLGQARQAQRGLSAGVAVGIMLGLWVATAAYIAAALVLSAGDEPLGTNFGGEGGYPTALSTVYFSFAAAFAWFVAFLPRRMSVGHRLVWIVLAVGLLFFAFDEQLMFHERWGDRLERAISSGPLRNLNDLLVILYGVVALPILAWMLPALLRYRMVVTLFVLAFGWYAVHTLIDSLSDPPTLWSQVFEESAKLFCGACLAMGSWLGAVGATQHGEPRA